MRTRPKRQRAAGAEVHPTDLPTKRRQGVYRFGATDVFFCMAGEQMVAWMGRQPEGFPKRGMLRLGSRTMLEA